ncbi:MAG: ClC family H(+)/Cl(-) exchange transporter [Olsenella sp.]|nr:ClC family H(+)/Cl(-) exchange transporter [Olsenella sp.]
MSTDQVEQGEPSGFSIVERHFSRRFQVYMVGEGVLVGLAGGLLVTLYRISLSKAESVLRIFTRLANETPALVVLWFAILMALCLIVCRLMIWEPHTQGSGIPQVDAEVMGLIDMSWAKVAVAKFVEGTLCCLGGLSLGREGPSVQLGAMAGKGVSRLIGRGRGEERLLVTCGAAAGMSAAFSAPLTGVLFAIEEIHKEFNAPLIISVMAAAVSSDFLASEVLGVEPVLQFVFAKDIPHLYYAYILVLGLFCGVVGALHNRGMFAVSEKLYDRLARKAPYVRVAIPFAIAGIMAFVCPELTCGGDEIIKQIMRPGILPFGTVALLLGGKYLFTAVSFGSGAPGGTLFPLCVMGALCGYLFADGAVLTLGLPTEFIPNFVVLGIGGLFASVVRAPVTAVVLAFELTGSLDALLSVSMVSMLSYVTANLMRVDPFYEHLLSRLVGSTPRDPGANGGPGEKILHTMAVGAGARVDGKMISEIPWPEGVRVVLVTRAGKEIIPTGATVLMSLDEVLLIMDSDREDETYAKAWSLFASSLTSNWTPKSSAIRARLSSAVAECASRGNRANSRHSS